MFSYCFFHCLYSFYLCFFFTDTATTEIYTLSLHDALPIWSNASRAWSTAAVASTIEPSRALCSSAASGGTDRKSTRLNSSHLGISYAVFCLKKKKKKKKRSNKTRK